AAACRPRLPPHPHTLRVNAPTRPQRLVPLAPLHTAAPFVDDPATTIVAHLEAEELRSALAELTEEQQQVVLLRFVAGQSTSEVAQALDKSENAIKQMQFRALRSLGRLMEQRR